MQRHSLSILYLIGAASVVTGAWSILPAQSAPRADISPRQVRADKVHSEIPIARSTGRIEIAAERPPVPLLRRPNETRVAVAAPVETMAAPVPAPVEQVTILRPPAESAAKALIEADGYKRVRVIDRGPDGKWRARGYRGTVEVALVVDDSGNVSSQ